MKTEKARRKTLDIAFKRVFFFPSALWFITRLETTVSGFSLGNVRYLVCFPPHFLYKIYRKRETYLSKEG